MSLYHCTVTAAALVQALPSDAAITIERVDPDDLPRLQALAQPGLQVYQPGDTILWQQPAANDSFHLVIIGA